MSLARSWLVAAAVGLVMSPGVACTGGPAGGPGYASGALTVVTDGPKVGPVVSLDVEGLDYVVRRKDGAPFVEPDDETLAPEDRRLWVEFYDDLNGPTLPFRDKVEVVSGSLEVRFAGAVTALGAGEHYIQAALMGTPVTDEASWEDTACLNQTTEVWDVPCTRSPILTISVTAGPPTGGTPDVISTPDVVSTPDVLPETNDGPFPLPVGRPDPISQGNCGGGDGDGAVTACTRMAYRDVGLWEYPFTCLYWTEYEVKLLGTPGASSLEVYDAEGNHYGPAFEVGDSQSRLLLASRSPSGSCVVSVNLQVPNTFKVVVKTKQENYCRIACFERPEEADARGCDCSEFCVRPCSGCSLPCNKDVPGYDCPFFESEIQRRQDCANSNWVDLGSFEHTGDACYRCTDGQQCCYAEGMDNGSGSYDVVPPWVVIKHGVPVWMNVEDHCGCDVVPLCGCLAHSGEVSKCEACAGAVAGCNMPGLDFLFCERQEVKDYDWCSNMGSIDTCFDRPDGL